jgi:hypothetical protein
VGCRDQPVTCRGRIAERYGLAPNKRKSWQFEGRCPTCKHGGFSLTAGDQGYNPPRHVWHCNCHRCHCDPADVRATMLKDGIDPGCLGTWKQRSDRPASPADPAAVLRAAMRDVLADDKIRALSDIKLRMLEVIEGKPAPADWSGFLAFAERAGVPRSKRYEAAARWGRCATAIVPESEK